MGRKKILVTGANGFVGRNFIADLSAASGEYRLFAADVDTAGEVLDGYIGECDFVMHFAGVNRPKEEHEFFLGNSGLTERLCEALERAGNPVPVLMTSSVQSDLENPYGRSKRAAERAVLDYGKRNGVPVYVFKLPNLFGKWSRPDYNSVVSTFCRNIVNGLPVRIDDPDRELTLLYIDDLLEELRRALSGEVTPGADGYCRVDAKRMFTVTLGRLAERISALCGNRKTLSMPELTGLDKALYSTCLSYLDPADFSYPLTAHSDARGGFYEFFKTERTGQMSVSVTNPGVTRGNHWHHTKTEKFLVVSGTASVRFRHVGGGEVIEYLVCGDRPEVVDIPVGYTHSITNLSETETLVTLIWANERFDPERPDTFYLEVQRDFNPFRRDFDERDGGNEWPRRN